MANCVFGILCQDAKTLKSTNSLDTNRILAVLMQVNIAPEANFSWQFEGKERSIIFKKKEDYEIKGDVTRNNSQRLFLAQHGYADDFLRNFCVGSF